MSSRLQLDVHNHSLGMRHLVNAYEVKAGIAVIAGNTVWSVPERLACTTKMSAINTLNFVSYIVLSLCRKSEDFTRWCSSVRLFARLSPEMLCHTPLSPPTTGVSYVSFPMKNSPLCEIYACDSGRHQRCPICFLCPVNNFPPVKFMLAVGAYSWRPLTQYTC